jgi:uncharacterized oxidoreductase
VDLELAQRFSDLSMKRSIMGAGGSVVENKKILITGGGSGIGLGLTERFVQLGSTVIICGRREDVLQAAKQKFPSIITKVCDLESETSREELFKWIQTEHENLDVLINNAGIQQWVGLEDPDFMKRARQEIAINVEAPLHLSHMFIQLPKLKTIMNVTSGLSYVPFAKVRCLCTLRPRRSCIPLRPRCATPWPSVA